MPSIRKRKTKKGEARFSAQIVIKRKGKIIHRESKTFDTKAKAKKWADNREENLKETQIHPKPKNTTISGLIDEYMNRYKSGRTKGYDLIKLKNSDLGKIDIYCLTSGDIIDHCHERIEDVLPQTINNDLIWLKTTLSTVKASNNYDYSLDMVDIAITTARKENLIAKSDTRDRRPTHQELLSISRKYYKKKTPYFDMLWFSIYSTRRISEVCRLQWGDLDKKKRTILVRKLKTPNGKVINIRAKLPILAYKIILKQPEGKDRDIIFPYNPKTVSDMFTDTCKLLDIEDLHLHDMRHEGISRLFEKRLTIPEVCLVSLHKSWSSLKKYTNLKPEDLDI